MLFYTSQLKEYNIQASDGELGKVKDLYFQDSDWEIRYAVVDTRKWLPGRKVLLSPQSFTRIDIDNENVEVKYDKETVKNSPPVPEDTDFTTGQEGNLIDYFGWNRFQNNALRGTERGFLGSFHDSQPKELVPEEPHLNREESESSTNLRSEDETVDFKVHAKDGKIGKLADMIYDDEDWKIKYIVVQSNTTYAEDAFYIYRTEQVETVDWFEKDLYVKDSVEGIKGNDPFTSKREILASL